MDPPDPTRRRMLLASLSLPWVATLQGCAAPLPLRQNPGSTQQAHAMLMESAVAHGLESFKRLHDVNVRYEGRWRPVVGRLQPALIDAGFRGGSEERLLLDPGIAAQAHTGPSGHKQVMRKSEPGGAGEVRVWRNGVEAQGSEVRAAAALVADGYSLFLLGPLLLADRWAGERSSTLETGGVETLHLDGHALECDVIRLRLRPGLGFSEADELALFLDRKLHLMRGVRFTLNGLESTQGAIAEVQTFDHLTLQGVRWPTRFYERLLRPLPLPVHNWRLTGLDLDRGLEPSEVDRSEFGGKASAAAAALPGR